jgi:hypothetical protein
LQNLTVFPTLPTDLESALAREKNNGDQKCISQSSTFTNFLGVPSAFLRNNRFQIAICANAISQANRHL